MTLLRKTWAEVRAASMARIGKSRQNGADWTNNPSGDDCALFTSSMLWGGNPGPIAWVDNYKQAGDGTYHAGLAGMEPGDVVLFDWPPKNGIGNHVEFVDALWNGIGNFPTIGANGSDTIAVKQRVRNTYYVMGYFHPAYGTSSGITAPASTGILTPVSSGLAPSQASSSANNTLETAMRPYRIKENGKILGYVMYNPIKQKFVPSNYDLAVLHSVAFGVPIVDITNAQQRQISHDTGL